MTAPARLIDSTDWQQLRRRLGEAASATEEAAQLSPQRARAILEERARLLARVPPVPPAPGEVLQVVTLTLGDERYAIATKYVREVVRLGVGHAPLPGAPEFIFGAFNLRGEVVTVLDLRPLLGVARREATERSRILVLGVSRVEAGLLVDDAHEVLSLRRDQLHDPPTSVVGASREYLKGVTSAALVVLDGAVLLRDGRLFVDEAEDR